MAGTAGALSRSMKLMNLTALVSATVLAVAVVGCKNTDETDNSGSTETLGTSESQLVEDDAEVNDTDTDLEAGLDDTTSGSTEADPGDPADGATDDEVGEKMRKNAGGFFKPAGCLVSTREGNKITHAFNGHHQLGQVTDVTDETKGELLARPMLTILYQF